MLKMPKQIVIDKSAFEGIGLDELCSFAERCMLVLPNTLLYECATTSEARQRLLIGRFEKLVSMGSRVCASVEAMVEWEAKHSSPYGEIAINSEHCEININAKSLEVKQASYNEQVGHLMRVAEVFHDGLSTKKPDLLRTARTWDASNDGRPDRLKHWLESVDSEDLHEWSRRMFDGITDAPDRFCVSGDWVTWHFLRLNGVILQEQALLTHHGGPPGAATLEHDLQDIFYVTLLCRADGLLSRDQKLVQPLARAAFPEKDVFSSLEEVPESYRCDWTNP